jgi:alpha-mannosidase
MPYYYEKNLANLANLAKQIEAAIYQPVAVLACEAWVTPEPVPFSERTSGEPKQFKLGDSWGKLWDCAWFHFTGVVPASAMHQKLVLLIDLSGEGCVFDLAGCPVLGLTTVSSDFDYTLGFPGKRVVEWSADQPEIDLWVEAGTNDLFGKYQNSGILKEAHIAICQENMRQLHHDFFVLHELIGLLPAESARRARIIAALSKVGTMLLDFNEAEAEAARAVLAPELNKRGGTPSLTISAIGHAHIDLAWLWPIRETIRKGSRTFSTALAMLERYQDYIFGASQAQLYQWVKDFYPLLYEKIKPRVAEGRWEVQGAMWVEADTNVSGGEALIRQIMYGKRFFQTEFGKDPHILWLPDVFGYTASLPQLLKKSGVEYFMTIKISWNTFNQFPHHTFWWQGLDGSRVLVHMPPEGTYNSSAAPRAIVAAEQQYLDKYVSEQCLMLFGIGDGGGGPGSEHLERLKREQNLAGLAPVVQERSENFFERLEENAASYKTWVGELYLEKHQGTYTSQARNKFYNRKLEFALRELEMVGAWAYRLGEWAYPTAQLEAIWKEVLLYQFHDILPGSSIDRVYSESVERYRLLLAQTQALTEQAQQTLASHINTTAYTAPLLVINTLSWERQEWLQYKAKWFRVRVPAIGYTILDFETDALTASALETLAQTLPLKATSSSLENDKLVLTFATDGSLQSVYDKEYQRELIASGARGNVLSVYADNGDAWDFPFDYHERSVQSFSLVSSSCVVQGSQVLMVQRYRYDNSSLEQTIVLTAGSRRIDFKTTIDWQETHKMLRTSFPLTIHARDAACDIQFGHVKRPTYRNSSWEMAKDEICAHKWVDLSQPDYGVALLNDCKYGYRVDENVLDLNLLRSSTFPGEEADRGHHAFTYALYPHAGDHLAGGVIKAGYALNQALNIAETTTHVGKLPSTSALLTVESENIIVEGLKKAEADSSLIVRLYEATGSSITTHLIEDLKVQSVALTTLMEEELNNVEATAPHQFELAFSPFEILTLKLK